MTFKAKQEVFRVLRDKFGDETGENASLLGEIVRTISEMPEGDEKSISAKPNYEAMYHEAMKKLENSEFVQESMRNEIQQLHFANARLVGFKEAIEMAYGKECG